MASDAVLKYLIDTNRPYSCADVTVNLRGAFTKSAVQKALDALSESGKIRCKLYGKQKVYVANQVENIEEHIDVEDYDSQLKSLAETLAHTSVALKKADADLKSLTSTPTTDAAKIQINTTRDNVDCLDKKINTLKVSTNDVSVDERKCISEEHGRLVKEYKKRKRICTEMIDLILEGYPKTKKTLLEELCIETDEMVDFKLLSQQ